MAEFEMNLEDNIFELHSRLVSGNWTPDPYEVFFVRDPKLRKIHKATVRDRVLYQAVYRVLYQVFDPGFIFHSYSSREFKGTHAGIESFETYIRKISKNYTHSCYALKYDIRKFFDSIDHEILFSLIEEKIFDADLLLLIRMIIDSFSFAPGKGLPLGNVTSQLFANIYLNELDQYIKHDLKIKSYVRYCDDFGIVCDSKGQPEMLVTQIGEFCKTELLLDLHPRKIIVRKVSNGVDFLGYVLLPHRRILRTNTKKRLLRKVNKTNIQSYLGVLSHCKGQKIVTQIFMNL